ncbi:MAG: hypothetical protein ACRBB0_23895 [Pelagimonas sp.]|uniref:hypothetical protein n=1 Tax=Pelagimonas sp. TaxID=2073170 RepID=UPI003D6C344F
MTRTFVYPGASVAAGTGAWAIFASGSEPPEPKRAAGQGAQGGGRNGGARALVHKTCDPAHYGGEFIQRAVAGRRVTGVSVEGPGSTGATDKTPIASLKTETSQ